MTSWMTCRMLSHSSSVSLGLFRCPVPWTNRTSSMTSCRCQRPIPPWWHSSNTEASALEWAQLVSLILTSHNGFPLTVDYIILKLLENTLIIRSWCSKYLAVKLNCFIYWLIHRCAFNYNPCIPFFRLWECPTRPASQGPACEELVSGHECVPSAALITVPDKGHKPIHSYAAATAANHGGKSQHDG